MPYFHVWFATRRRNWLLQGDVLDAVRMLLPEIAVEHSISLLESEAVIDHVHLLLEIEDKAQLPQTMMLLKGVSSRRIFQQFPELRIDAHTNSL